MKNIIKGLIFTFAALAVFLVVVPSAHAQTPTVVATSATSITQTSAVLNGTANPNGFNTSAWFFMNSNSYGTTNVGSGTTPVPMTYTITGLTPNTTYSYTLDAVNINGPASSNVISFTTLPPAPPPIIMSTTVTSITQTSAVLGGSIDPNGSTTSGWVEYNSNNYGTVNNQNSPFNVTYSLTGLTPNTTYSFRLGAVNSGGPVLGNVVSFTTLPANTNPPIVVTNAATSITQTSAVLNGTVNPNGLTSSGWFEFQSNNYGTVNGMTGTSPIAMTYTLTGLQPNTNYCYRISAVNNDGPALGNTVCFNTLPVSNGAPIMTTTAATAITTNSAAINGNWDANGFNTTTWFEWGLTMSLGNTTTSVVQGLGTGSTSFNLSALTPNTTYYFRVVGQNVNGTTNGNILSFVTNNIAGAPIMTTVAASSVGTSSATLNGNWDANGFNTTTWFEWGLTMSLGNTTGSVFQGLGTGTTASGLTGLSQNTTYYFRVVGQNINGTTNGAIMSFTTQTSTTSGGGGGGGSPIITTNSASNITSSQATLNGFVDPYGSSTSYWFQWGTNPSLLSNTTNSVSIGTASGNRSETISSLSPSTTYYFRIAAQNTYGMSYGSILSFTTPAIGQNSGGGPGVTTSLATSVTQTGAKLNGVLTVTTSLSTQVWFEWGGTLSLGNQTGIQNLSGTQGNSFEANISGLAPDTIYYFKAVAKDSNGTTNGQILIFKTLANSNNNNNNNGNNGNNNSGNTGNNGNSGTGSASITPDVSLKLSASDDNARVGDEVDYSVEYTNLGSVAAKNAILKVILPQELSFVESSNGIFSESERELLYNIGDIEPARGGVIILKAKVKEEAKDKVLVTTANLAYTGSNGSQGDKVAYGLVNILGGENLLGAAGIFGANFLPKTLMGWIILLLILILLIVAGRKMYVEMRSKKIPQA
jgi:hypothetical protein